MTLRTFASGAALVAVIVSAAGCGAQSDPSVPAAAPAAPSATLGVVALQARIGGDTVHSSGAVIDAERGRILTTAHTLWGATSLKVTTGLAVLYGRIVARDPCDDLAVVELQPAVAGLVSLRGSSVKTGADATVRVVRRRWSTGAEPSGAVDEVRDTLARVTVSGPLERAPGGLALSVRLKADASGAPLLDAAGRMTGMARVVARDGQRAEPTTVPWAEIERRLAELEPGAQTVSAGWRDRYRCAPMLHAIAHEFHPAYKRADARLNAPVHATRLPGTEELDNG